MHYSTTLNVNACTKKPGNSSGFGHAESGLPEPTKPKLEVRSIQLIVNADDFGTSRQVNEAVVRAFKEGVLTSCSLMVTGQAFDEAIQLAKENRGLAVGI